MERLHHSVATLSLSRRIRKISREHLRAKLHLPRAKKAELKRELTFEEGNALLVKYGACFNPLIGFDMSSKDRPIFLSESTFVYRPQGVPYEIKSWYFAKLSKNTPFLWTPHRRPPEETPLNAEDQVFARWVMALRRTEITETIRRAESRLDVTEEVTKTRVLYVESEELARWRMRPELQYPYLFQSLDLHEITEEQFFRYGLGFPLTSDSKQTE
jgi:hypothetical protein